MLFFINSYQSWDFVIVSIAYILVILFTLSLHEFAHAWTAYKCGDMTPKMQGRVTINPFKHIDTIGFCVVLYLDLVGLNLFNIIQTILEISKRA